MIDLASKFGRKVTRHLKQEYVVWLKCAPTSTNIAPA